MDESTVQAGDAHKRPGTGYLTLRRRHTCSDTHAGLQEARPAFSPVVVGHGWAGYHVFVPKQGVGYLFLVARFARRQNPGPGWCSIVLSWDARRLIGM